MIADKQSLQSEGSHGVQAQPRAHSRRAVARLSLRWKPEVRETKKNLEAPLGATYSEDPLLSPRIRRTGIPACHPRLAAEGNPNHGLPAHSSC